MLITSDIPEALPGLGRKLPHYHKYSYLGFQGKEPANILKGRFQVRNSPMTRPLHRPAGGETAVPMGRLPDRQALANRPLP